MNLLFDLQKWIHAALTGYVNNFAASHDWLDLGTMLPVGFLFGLIHALTPGHGKSILSSYVLGSRLTLWRTTTVAGALALTHVASAVVIALIAAPLITRTLGGAGRAPLLENVSRGLLVAIGLWILLRAFRGRSHVHGEGVIVGVVAGLVPCPLTLFMMFLALSRGVPEAGFTFALAMMLGVGATLCVVAVGAAYARNAVMWLGTEYAASIEKLSRLLDGTAGALLIVIGAYELSR